MQSAVAIIMIFINNVMNSSDVAVGQKRERAEVSSPCYWAVILELLDSEQLAAVKHPGVTCDV